MPKSSKSGLAVIVILILVAIVLAVGAYFISQQLTQSKNEEPREQTVRSQTKDIWCEDEERLALYEGVMKKVYSNPDAYPNGVIPQQEFSEIQRAPISTKRSLEAATNNPEETCELILWDRKYIDIPPEIFELQNLVNLDLSGSELVSIPAEISKLQKLRVLGLAKNNLRTLENVTSLENLVVLDIADNPLCKSEIESLQNARPELVIRTGGVRLIWNSADQIWINLDAC